MSKTSLWVMDKRIGIIQEIGTDPNDAICLTDGNILYQNKCNFGSRWNDKNLKGRYAILPSLYGDILQPDVCILNGGHCGYLIEECSNCPVRTGMISESNCEFK